MSAAPVILASASATRIALLRNAGLAFESRRPGVDEEALKAELQALPPADLAMALAKSKALPIAGQNPDAVVIGADQVLNFEGRALGKPPSLTAARDRLWGMRGRSHVLETAVACAQGKKILWTHLAEPSLTMRAFSREALDSYCREAGDAILSSAGGYQLEGPGIQLFERVEGDYFAILGLPLLPLLGFLRSEGLVAA